MVLFQIGVLMVTHVGQDSLVQKWRKIATFLIFTFELFVGIWNLIKNRPYGRFCKSWLRGMDLNHRPSGYEPDELPGCSTPR